MEYSNLLNIKTQDNTPFCEIIVDDDTPIQRIIIEGAKWTDESLECYVPLMNARITADRFQELININQKKLLLNGLEQEEIANFFGSEPENMKYLSFQEYEGTKNPEAISTFFKYAYCFNKDFDDIAIDYEERYIIWFAGDELPISKIRDWAKPFEEKAVIVFGNSRKEPYVYDEIKIRVWRMIEFLQN